MSLFNELLKEIGFWPEHCLKGLQKQWKGASLSIALLENVILIVISGSSFTWLRFITIGPSSIDRFLYFMFSNDVMNALNISQTIQ